MHPLPRNRGWKKAACRRDIGYKMSNYVSFFFFFLNSKKKKAIFSKLIVSLIHDQRA